MLLYKSTFYLLYFTYLLTLTQTNSSKSGQTNAHLAGITLTLAA